MIGMAVADYDVFDSRGIEAQFLEALHDLLLDRVIADRVDDDDARGRRHRPSGVFGLADEVQIVENLCRLDVPRRSIEWVRMHGRLKPGVDLATANAAVAGTAATLAKQFPSTNQFKGATVEPYVSMGAAGWHVCFDVLDRLLDGSPIGRLVGPDAITFGGWQRLNAEYAQQFGVEAPSWPPQAQERKPQ